MALMTCPDCGRECSTSAAQCPHCGRPFGRQRQQEGFLHKVGRFIWFFVLAIVIGSCAMCKMCNGTSNSNTSKSSSNTITDTSNSSKQIVGNPQQQASSSEILADVNRSLKFQAKFTYRDYYSIYSLLNQIPQDAAEYQEAQKILTQYKTQIASAKQKVEAANNSSSEVAIPQGKPTQEDPKLEKIRKEAYKIGLQSGGNRPSYITEDTEVKNTAQVQILAETAADLVYKPKPEHRQMWVFQFRLGFITGYNKRRPDAPIRNMVGDVVDEAHQ